MDRLSAIGFVLAAAREAGAASVVEADLQPKDPERGPPPKGADVGAYNFYWLDPGTTMTSSRCRLGPSSTTT